MSLEPHEFALLTNMNEKMGGISSDQKNLLGFAQGINGKVNKVANELSAHVAANDAHGAAAVEGAGVAHSRSEDRVFKWMTVALAAAGFWLAWSEHQHHQRALPPYEPPALSSHLREAYHE